MCYSVHVDNQDVFPFNVNFKISLTVMLWLQCIHFLLFLNTSQSFPILLSTGTVLGSSQELSWRLVTLNTKIPKRYDDVNGHDLSRIRKLDFFFKINLL